MSLLRFANPKAMAPLLRGILGGAKDLVPSSTLGKVMTFGPDVAFAGLSAAAAPEGTSLPERAAIAGVDFLGFGLAPSLLGRAAGRGIAKGVFKQTNPEVIERAMDATEMGFQVAPALFGMQNPILENAYRREAEGQQQLAERQRLEEEERRQQDALFGTLAMSGGMLAGSARGGSDLLGLYGG